MNNTESKTERTWQEDLRLMTPGPGVLIALAVLLVAFCGINWSSFGALGRTWMQPDYQHGPFVPLFSLYLLWMRREMIIPFRGRWSWWGMAFMAVWALMRIATVYFNFGSLPEMSMIPFLAGLALFVGGWQMLHWAWPSLVFLVFMLPLPGDLQALLNQQLQAIATKISVFTIQTLGIMCHPSGNVIWLTSGPIEVEQACSGLRMMMMFFALCIGAAFVVNKPLWEKLVIIASAAPIAIVSNVARIVVTAICLEMARRWPGVMDSEKAMHVIHDWAGYLIEMPCGMLLVWVEVTLLSKLLMPPLDERPLTMGTILAGQASSGSARRDRPERRG
jgi:exosortase